LARGGKSHQPSRTFSQAGSVLATTHRMAHAALRSVQRFVKWCCLVVERGTRIKRPRRENRAFVLSCRHWRPLSTGSNPVARTRIRPIPHRSAAKAKDLMHAPLLMRF
jgi:hypothetical protein